ncbi:MAG: CotH kinase family protein [Vicinamibacterales bacterium]|jgi:hypothetical protein|nr:CotH kinase family protein [Vicinamibacterales bacterium]
MTRIDLPARHNQARGGRAARFAAALTVVCFVALAGAAAGQTTPPPAAEPDPADALFDPSAVHDLRLTMKPEDWETLKARCLWDTYYPADFQWRDMTVARVGIRSRGSGSRNSHKPGIKIDFNEFVADQKFLKQKALILANAVQDPGMLNRRLANLIFTRMGLPAPRVVHARLFVNGEYAGLYELVEEIEKPMMGRVFGRDSNGKKRDGGYLFEYNWDENFNWTYPTDDLAFYAALFDPKTRDEDAPSLLYGPIEDMFQAINESRDGDFEAAVGQYLDLRQFVQFLAVERFTADIDGFLGKWGPNNFYVYRFEGGTQSVVIPWDKDLSFYELYDDVFEGLERTVLGRRVMAVPALRRLYLETLLACAASVAQPDQPESAVSWFEAELLRERAQILEAARADRRKPFSNERIDEAHDEILSFARQRSAYVIDQVQRALERGILQEK